MDFSLLPEEIIEQVAEHLSLNDLIACSMVNTQWRRAFDTDRIWKKCYTFHQNYFKKRVTKQRNSSKYFFGGCKSKKHVFRELQVGKNLVKGKYDVVKVDNGRFYCDNLLDVIDDAGNHWLFISCLKNYGLENVHRIEVWNMNDEPIRHQSRETSLAVPHRLIDSQMRAIKDKLYYMEGNILIAFEFSRPVYNLKFLFLLNCLRSMEFLTVSLAEVAMISKPNMVLGFVHTYMNVRLSTVPLVQVWSEDSSLLYKNYSTNEIDQMQAQVDSEEIKLNPILEVKDGGTSNNVLVIYNSSSHKISFVLFNVKTFQYTSLFIKTCVQFGYSEFVNEVVIVFYYQLNYKQEAGRGNKVPKLLCCSTDGHLLYEPEIRSSGLNNVYHNIVTCNEGKEVLVLDSLGEVTVFDVFQQKQISMFRIACDDNRVVITFVKNNIIILQHEGKNKTIQEVWDFKCGKRLYGFGELTSSFCPTGLYKLTFTKSYRSPPKIFAIKAPEYFYDMPNTCSNGEIVMLSFL